MTKLYSSAKAKNKTGFYLLLVFFSFASVTATAQCPDATNVTSNGFCTIVSWITPPSPLPQFLTIAGTQYAYLSGPGTAIAPATYKSGGGNGACNANQSGFTGILLTSTGSICAYTNGALSNAALPLKLISFGYKKSGATGLEFNWQTASEENMQAFAIQMSTDGLNYTTVATVPASGQAANSYTYSYSFNALAGSKYFFRLKMVESTATFSLSNVLQYINQKQGVAFLRPTISSSTIVLYSNTDNTTQINASLYNMQGQQLKQLSFSPGAASIDISGLNTGSYALKLSTGEVLRFVKQ